MKCHGVRYLIPLVFAIVIQTALAFGPVAGFGLQGPMLPAGAATSALVFSAPQGQGALGQPRSTVGINQSLAANSREFNTLDWNSIIIICFPQDLQTPWAPTASMFQATPSTGKIGLPVDGFPAIPPAWEPALPYVRSNGALNAGSPTGYIAGPVVGEPPVTPDLLPYVNIGAGMATENGLSHNSFEGPHTSRDEAYAFEPLAAIDLQTRRELADFDFALQIAIEEGLWDAYWARQYSIPALSHGREFAEDHDLRGAGDNAADAVRHSHWTFDMSKQLGYETAISIATMYEAHGTRKANYDPEVDDNAQWGSNLMDHYNNEVGARAAQDEGYSNMTGHQASEQLHDQGHLMTEPPTPWDQNFDPVSREYLTPPTHDDPNPGNNREPTGVGNIA